MVCRIRYISWLILNLHAELACIAVSEDVGRGGVVVGLVEVIVGCDLVGGDVGSDHDGVDDLYSLGGRDALRYELLLGERKFVGELLHVLGVLGGRERSVV